MKNSSIEKYILSILLVLACVFMISCSHKEIPTTSYRLTYKVGDEFNTLDFNVKDTRSIADILTEHRVNPALYLVDSDIDYIFIDNESGLCYLYYDSNTYEVYSDFALELVK